MLEKVLRRTFIFVVVPLAGTFAVWIAIAKIESWELTALVITIRCGGCNSSQFC